jgi:glucans biosynthesis protein
LLIEPLSDWGRGAVRLVEIPTRQEVNDNIVAFWVPEEKPVVGELREFQYRLHWGALPVNPDADIAYVHETRAGLGGVSGADKPDGTRKFVIDFAGGMLAALPADTVIEPVVSVSGGSIAVQTLSKIEDHGIWRLVIDVMPNSGVTVELRAQVAGFGRKLTENWFYQWVPA